MTLPFYDYDSDFFSTDDLLFLAGASGKAVEATATGNPLTFLTDLAKPLKSLLIPFTPVQSGSGDPSPQNVRPIVPWEGLKVYHSGADTSNPIETDISFPSPVYGGEHEAVSGKLLNNYEGHVTTWGAIKTDRTSGGYRQGVITFENEIPVSGQSGASGTYQKCNIAKYQWDDFNGTSHFYTAGQDGAYVARILLPDDTPDETEIVVIAKLKTPQEITLTPEQITALKGENTIWSDANGDCSVTFLKKG